MFCVRWECGIVADEGKEGYAFNDVLYSLQDPVCIEDKTQDDW